MDGNQARGIDRACGRGRGAVGCGPGSGRQLRRGDRKSSPLVYALDIGGKTGLLEGVTGLPAVAPLASGAAPKAAAKPSVGPASLTLLASHGLPAAFYDWVSGALGGKALRTTLGLHGTDIGGRFSQQATLSEASVVTVGFPALEASGIAPLAMSVKASGMLQVEPVAKPMAAPQMSELARRKASQRWTVSGYNLVLGKVDARRGVMRIEAFNLTPGGPLQLQLTASDATARLLEDLGPRPPVKGQKLAPAPAPLQEGRLELLSASGQVLATILLLDTGIASVTYTRGNPQSGVLEIGHVSLQAKRARINFAPAVLQ